jgi:hypothetical protein
MFVGATSGLSAHRGAHLHGVTGKAGKGFNLSIATAADMQANGRELQT